MRRLMATAVAGFVIVLALGAGSAWAETKITVTREESKPKTVEIRAGEEVEWVNASGGTAHLWFSGTDAVRFYIGKGSNRVKFTKPGTYEYTVHISGTKVHSHTGTVVVK